MAVRRDREQLNNPGAPGGQRPDGTAVPADHSEQPLPALPGAAAASAPSAQREGASDAPTAAADSTAQPDSHASDGVGASDDRGQSGVDTRRRGWFWHWNSVVTQYAPLIGLKGVGLLNSYTVWTDRREESPHRGYAFPSQQSEADFYGEERSELITINKILVALDLIEIRKEMVLRVDERGRKWRVPHNLYRVKDRPDGVDLRAADVLNVARLARDDESVYRYVRRVFSPRFKPIDRDNVWHAILAELADHPLWLEMQLRTEQRESRASARSRAGHRTRASREDEIASAIVTDGQLGHELLGDDEREVLGAPSAETGVRLSNSGFEAENDAVAPSNDGFRIDVGSGNDGSGAVSLTSEAQSNTGHAPNVAPSNSTYHQTPTTTTTTTSAPEDRLSSSLPGEPVQGLMDGSASLSGDSERARSATSVASGRGVAAGRPGPGLDSAATQRAGLDAALPESAFNTPSSQPASQLPDQANAPPGRVDERADAGRADVGLPVLDVDGGQERGPGSDDGRQQVRADAVDAARRSGAAHGGSGSRGSDEDGDTAAGNETPGATHLGLASEEFAAGRPAAGAGAGARDGVRGLADGDGRGPLGDPSALVVSLFEAANDRRSSALERILLAELERDAAPAARAAGSSGADWVAEALREAVSSGSSFVAPKRIREIITRWSRESAGPEASRARSAGRLPARRSAGPDEPQDTTRTAPQAAPSGVDVGEGAPERAPAVRLPGGADGAAIWSQVLADLARLLDASAFERLLAGSGISRFRKGTVEIRVASPSAAGKLSAEYRPLVERHLNARLPRAVAVSFVSEPSVIEPAILAEEDAVDLGAVTIVISRADYDLASRVWQAIRDELVAALPARDLEGLGTVVPLGEDAGGVMLLGTTSSRALRLVDGRCRAEIERALSALLGRPVTVRAVTANGWAVAPTA